MWRVANDYVSVHIPLRMETLTREVRMKAKGDVDSPSKKRSEVVTVRLDPRLKYLAEIAARKQRRTLSGYIEWAVERSLEQVVLYEGTGYGGDESESVASIEKTIELWDVDESERVVKLALNFPELLTYEEQLIWRLVRDCGYVWSGAFSGPDGEYKWTIKADAIKWTRVREYWECFKQVADGRMQKDVLPTWEKYGQPKQSVDQARASYDDEIPF